MFSLTGHPAEHCSVTRMKSVKSRPGTRLPPKCVPNVPTPPSKSSLLVAGEVHVPCCTRWYSPRPYALRPRYPAISGALVALAVVVDDPGAPARMYSLVEARHAGSMVSFSAPLSHGNCSSQKPLTRFRGVSCDV